MVGLIETKKVGELKHCLGQKCSEERKRLKPTKRVKHSVLFVKSLSQKVIPWKRGCSVCFSSYEYMNVVSLIHSEHSGVRAVNRVARYYDT